ncbi:MAG TPA: hypothetical protein VIM02_02180 [Rhizomicrobium sp.]|jgi:hypothetical protein
MQTTHHSAHHPQPRLRDHRVLIVFGALALLYCIGMPFLGNLIAAVGH